MADRATDDGAAKDTRGARQLTRRRNVLLAQHHRQQGWSIAQIAHLLDRAPATRTRALTLTARAMHRLGLP